MNLIDPQHCTLVLVDYQRRLMPVIHRGPEVLAHAVQLADIARTLGIAVLGTEQNPRHLGPNDDAIRERCDATLSKMHFDACADGLLARLTEPNGAPRREIVIAGCEAHVCLLQTALGLLRSGRTVWVVAQACGSRTPENQELAIERLRQAGAGIVSVEMVAFEWLRSCGHERFKSVLALIKQGTR